MVFTLVYYCKLFLGPIRLQTWVLQAGSIVYFLMKNARLVEFAKSLKIMTTHTHTTHTHTTHTHTHTHTHIHTQHTHTHSLHQITQLHSGLQHYCCAILTGPSGSGKTACLRTLAAAYHHIAELQALGKHVPGGVSGVTGYPRQVDVVVINSAAYTEEEVSTSCV